MKPFDLSRGRKPFEPKADPCEVIGDKSYFTFQELKWGYALDVHRRGFPVETIFCETEGELNRARRRLSDQGFIGINPRAK